VNLQFAGGGKPDTIQNRFSVQSSYNYSTMQEHAVQLKVTVVQAVNKIFRGMNMDLTNETVVKTNLELVGVLASSSPTSQQLVQPKLIHGILALDPSKVS